MIKVLLINILLISGLSNALAVECSNDLTSFMPNVQKDLIVPTKCSEEYFDKDEICECAKKQSDIFDSSNQFDKEIKKKYYDFALKQFKKGINAISNKVTNFAASNSYKLPKSCNLEQINKIRKCITENKKSGMNTSDLESFYSNIKNDIKSSLSSDAKEVNELACIVKDNLGKKSDKKVPLYLLQEIRERAAASVLKELVENANGTSWLTSELAEKNPGMSQEDFLKLQKKNQNYRAMFIENPIFLEFQEQQKKDSKLNFEQLYSLSKKQLEQNFEKQCDVFFKQSNVIFCESDKIPVPDSVEDIARVNELYSTQSCEGEECSLSKNSTLQENKEIDLSCNDKDSPFEDFKQAVASVTPPTLQPLDKDVNFKELQKKELKVVKDLVCDSFPPPLSRLEKSLKENNCSDKSADSSKCIYLQATLDVMKPRLKNDIKENHGNKLAEIKKEIKRNNPTIKAEDLENQALKKIQDLITPKSFFAKTKKPSAVLDFIGEDAKGFSKTPPKAMIVKDEAREKDIPKDIPVAFDSKGNIIPRAANVNKNALNKAEQTDSAQIQNTPQQNFASTSLPQTRQGPTDQESEVLNRVNNWGQNNQVVKSSSKQAYKASEAQSSVDLSNNKSATYREPLPQPRINTNNKGKLDTIVAKNRVSQEDEAKQKLEREYNRALEQATEAREKEAKKVAARKSPSSALARNLASRLAPAPGPSASIAISSQAADTELPLSGRSPASFYTKKVSRPEINLNGSESIKGALTNLLLEDATKRDDLSSVLEKPFVVTTKKGDKELKVLVKKVEKDGSVNFEVSSDGGNEADKDYRDFILKVHKQLNTNDFKDFLKTIAEASDAPSSSYSRLSKL